MMVSTIRRCFFYASRRTVAFMLPPHVDVNIALPGMVGSVQVRDSGQEWSRIF